MTSKNKSNVPEGLHTLTSNNHTQGGNEEASILIVDKIIKISEVTCEMTDADNFINQEKIDGSQNSVAESVQDIVKVGGTNDHSTPAHTDDVVLPYVSEIDGMVQEKQMGNVKDLTECGQAQVLMFLHTSFLYIILAYDSCSLFLHDLLVCLYDGISCFC